MAPDGVSGFMALTAGLLSFLSPCCLPLIPVYVTYLAGGTAPGSDTPGAARPWFNGGVLFNALAFVLGFSFIFVSLGLSATVLGQLLLRNRVLVRKVSGVLIFFLGLHLAGWLRLPFLEGDHRWHGVGRKAGQAGIGLGRSFLLGIAFAAGWSPCAGPILGSILLLTGTVQTMGAGVGLLSLYALGLALPFLLVALFLEPANRFLGKLKCRGRWIQFISGFFLMAMGILVYFNLFQRLASW